MERRRKNLILGAQMAPKIDPETLCFALGPWRPVSRKIDPKTRPRALLRASGDEKNVGRAQKRPKELSLFFGTPQNIQPPRWGGGPFSAPAFWLPFLENRCWRLGGVQKSRSPGFQGPLLGLGGEAKASPTTSKLVV